MHWTYPDIQRLPMDVYEVLLSMLNAEAQKQTT